MIIPRLLARDREHLRRLQSQYPKLLADLIPEGCTSLLDVGCGSASPLTRMPVSVGRTVGVDLLPPRSDERGRPASGHHEYIQRDIRLLGDRFPAGSFDVVAALDVIEHLEEQEGWQLLSAIELIARRRVIVFTPNGFLPQLAYDGNPHQVHKSGWTVDDFDDRGYQMIGVHGWKPLRSERATIAWRPRSLWGRVSLYTQGLFIHRPRHAFQLLCWRDLHRAEADDGSCAGGAV